MEILNKISRKEIRDRKYKVKRQRESIFAILNSFCVRDCILNKYLKGIEKLLKKQEGFYSLAILFGNRFVEKLLGAPEKSLCEYLLSIFKTEKGILVGDIALPFPKGDMDKKLFYYEFTDILLPHLFEKYNCILDDSFYDEGPYEMNDKVSLKKDDIVIDCGANMGMFSALASTKGCKVYAFEPMNYIIESYLKKTVDMNINIEIVPFALSDKEGETFFRLELSNIGGSKKDNDFSHDKIQHQKVKVTTIDKFVQRNNLKKVDFIKADIEGEERFMLLGAEETIRRFAPKLSICTYHHSDDPKVLRDILTSIQPRYKIVEKYKKMYAYT